MHVLKAGMFARVKLPVGEPTTAFVVPKDAIVLGGKTPVVMVLESLNEDTADTKTSTVRPVPVKLKPASGDQIQVLGSFEGTEQVVVRGNERLRRGQTVRVVQQLGETVAESRPASSNP